MKNLILFLFCINLFAWPSFMDDKPPKWIDTHSKYEFIGISTPKKTKQEALNNALVNGLTQVSNQLGVIINSDFSSSQSTKDNHTSKKTEIKTNLKSFSKIENYQIKNQYCEENDNKYICYVLIHFDKQDFIKLKQDTQKRLDKLNNLLKKFEDAINNNEYKKAKNIYSQIILIPESNFNNKFKILKAKFNSMINLVISDLNTNVLPLENIKFSLISNKDGFLYVIYNNGLFTKLVANEKVDKNKPIIIDSKYQYNSNQNQKLIVIFSKYKLNIPTDANDKILKSNNLWRVQLKSALQNLDAIIKKFNIKVKKDIKRVCIETSNNPISKATKEKIIEFLQNAGIKIDCKNYDYVINIKISKEKIYAPEEYGYIYEITFKFIIKDDIIGEIDSITIDQPYTIESDEDIADDITQENLDDLNTDWHLDSLYKTIIGQNK